MVILASLYIDLFNSLTSIVQHCSGAEPMGGARSGTEWHVINMIGFQVPPLFSLALNDVNLNKK